ncbi:hypothetical protein JCM10207_008652 [Rhodosporidiobolus poonsookiae]
MPVRTYENVRHKALTYSGSNSKRIRLYGGGLTNALSTLLNGGKWWFGWSNTSEFSPFQDYLTLWWEGIDEPVWGARGRFSVQDSHTGATVWQYEFNGARFPPFITGSLSSTRFFTPEAVSLKIELEDFSSSRIPDAASRFAEDLASAFTSASFSAAAAEEDDGLAPPDDDSDDETDRTLPPHTTLDKPSGDSKTVVIRETCYSTYLSVLAWVQTSYLSFAPFTSSFCASPSTSLSDARAARRAALSAYPSVGKLPLPPPVSPKSAYVLADLLDLPDLAQLALQNLKAQLQPQTAAYDLFCTASNLHPRLRDTVLDFVLEHKGEVAASEAMQAVIAQAQAGELPLAAMGTWTELLKRLTAAG